MKKIVCFILVTVLLLSGTVTAFALDNLGKSWYVHFTPDAKMESNYGAVNGDEMSEIMQELQPGDSATFYMTIRNDHVESTDWYMTNEVLRSLEQSQTLAEGGAYSYVLTYTGPGGQTETLFSSFRVGGEDEADNDGREGLREATFSLEDWFYLDTLTTGQSGQLELLVELEGETQGNRYQDTLAQLQMNFAVELTQNPTTRTTYTPVRTGDEQDWMLNWSAVLAVCGLAILILAVIRAKREREAKGNA